jgi:hypothetical protein
LIARTLDNALEFFADDAEFSRRRTPVSNSAESDVRGDQGLHHLDIQVKRFAISSHYFLGEDTGGRNDSGHPAASILTPYRFAL